MSSAIRIDINSPALLTEQWHGHCCDSFERVVMRLTFFTKNDCELCDAAWFVVRKVIGNRPIEIDTVDISGPGALKWCRLYSEHIPVVHIDGEEFCRHRVIEKDLRAALKGCD